MFISTSVLKKHMKKAYDTGFIHIGNKEEGLFISTGHIAAWIDNEYIPNKVKALVMEFAGTMPDIDSVFKVSKADPTPQYELDQEYFYLRDMWNKFKIPCTRTKVHLDLSESHEIFQNNKSKNLSIVRDDNLALIDLGEIDYDYENLPTGPSTMFGGQFMWSNATCKLLITASKMPEDNEVLENLKLINFEEMMK